MDVEPMRRYEWERLVLRIVMPERHKLVALILATYADPDGSRVRPGLDRLAYAVRGTDEAKRSVRRVMTSLVNDWGLLELVRRGGGRGGQLRTNEYRLVIPVDLLERHELLGPDMRPVSVASWVATETPGPDEREPELEPGRQQEQDVPPQKRADLEEPITAVSTPAQRRRVQLPDGSWADPGLATLIFEAHARLGLDGLHEDVDGRLDGDLEAVDNHVSVATMVATDTPVDRPAARPPDDRLSGHFGPIDWPLCLATYQPRTNPITVDELSTQPQTARTRGRASPPRARADDKCVHGLSAGRRADGCPRCAFCRRDAVHAARPLVLAEPVSTAAEAAA